MLQMEKPQFVLRESPYRYFLNLFILLLVVGMDLFVAASWPEISIGERGKMYLYGMVLLVNLAGIAAIVWDTAHTAKFRACFYPGYFTLCWGEQERRRVDCSEVTGVEFGAKGLHRLVRPMYAIFVCCGKKKWYVGCKSYRAYRQVKEWVRENPCRASGENPEA